MGRNDPFFWIRRNRLRIPGVRGEHLLMHITDTHINTADAMASPEEREKAEQQEAMWRVFKEKFARANGEPYGEAQKLGTREGFEKLLALAEELEPEALLLAGDNLEYTHPAGVRYLERTLGAYPGRLLCVPGNHEDPACGSLWGPGVRTLELEGFRIAAVDNSRKTVAPEDLEALRALCREGVPLILLCHVPISTPRCAAECTEPLIGQPEYFYMDEKTADENGRAFIDLCVEESAVKAVLCGHVHGWHAMEPAPGKPQYVGSMGMIGAVHLLTVCG